MTDKTNKCAHINLISQLNKSEDIKSISYYFNQLKPFLHKKNKAIKGGNENEWIKCSNCSFELMCPHKLDYYTQLTASKTENITEKIREFLIKKYSSQNELSDGTYLSYLW